MLDSLGEAHVVVDLLDTSEIMVVSFDDEPMEGFEGYLEKEDDPKEDQDIDELVEEQQMDQEVDDDMGEQQVDQEINEVEFSASDSSFDLVEEPEDESYLDYDPSRDH